MIHSLMKPLGMAMLAGVAGSMMAQVAVPSPQGTPFPLMMYEASTSDASTLAPYGWNIIQNYGLNSTNDNNDYLEGLLNNAVGGLAAIPASGTNHPFVEWPLSEVKSWIQNLAPNPNLAWWSLPEEMNPTIPSELQILNDYAAWIRANDPQQRPAYMYSPNGTTATAISQIAVNVDVIGLGCYCEYIGMPHAWVRFSVQEALVNGITAAGKVIGTNYLTGQKTPIAVLFCAQSIDGNTNPPTIPSPDQTYHDFWSAIVSGARGISVFAYYHALHDAPSLATNLALLNLAASQITGPERIGDVILYGTPNTNVTFTVAAGPIQTVAFQPPRQTNLVLYPSLNVLSLTFSTNVYVIAVNSTDQAVTAISTNLPWVAASASLPFESRAVTVTEGSFTDLFPPWGVHIYKLPGYAVLDPSLDAAIGTALGKPPASLIPLDLTNLASLSANHFQIRDLTGLGAATNLVALSLNGNAVQDLTPLTNIVQLQSLDIEQNQVSDLKPLVGLTNLNSLSLGGNPITNYWVLTNCTDLAKLSMRSAKLTDLTFLEQLTGLQSLALCNNAITDPSPLVGLTGLTNLDLSGNLLTNINFVTNLTRLRFLNLASNLLTDLSPLTGLMQIPGSLYADVSFNQLDLSSNSLATTVITALLSAGDSARYTPQFPLDSDGDGMPDSWEIAHGLNPQDPSDALIDSDGDALMNLLEYALGTDPRNPADAVTAMAVSFVTNGASSYLTLSFKTRNTPVRLEYVPEVSGDQANWYSDSTHVQTIARTPGDQFDYVTVKDAAPVTLAAPRFFRLRIVHY